ncbi:peptidylprolyl isomerase [Elusimicrobiota bacterium]
MIKKTLICFITIIFSSMYLLAEDERKENTIHAKIITPLGTIVCKLFDKEAPKTVANFVGLSEGSTEYTNLKGEKVKGRFYDGLIFHRVIANFMIQTGCPLGKGTAGPGYKFDDEFSKDLNFDIPGRLAMANAGPNTNGSQFFITEVPTPWLNQRHTIFGQVVEGQDIVSKIARVDVDKNNKPYKDIIIKKIEIIRD